MPRMKILYVAYPLLPLSDEVAGGAEQVLLSVAREVSSRGHEVTIAAAERSIVPGQLLATGRACHKVDDFERRKAEHDAEGIFLVESTCTKCGASKTVSLRDGSLEEWESEHTCGNLRVIRSKSP